MKQLWTLGVFLCTYVISDSQKQSKIYKKKKNIKNGMSYFTEHLEYGMHLFKEL